MLISIEAHRTCDFLGGWGMLISIETHRTCDFLGGWGGQGPDHLTPSGSTHPVLGWGCLFL